ncbi:MAG TPA: glycosyltransferase family 39 protein [Acidimicrobiales bacterium]|nr:glycosyltransferase family 39 protein [Acidimicrobiales bacterium]
MPPAAVIGGFLVAALVLVPVGAPVAIHDDWVYARAVQVLVQDGRFELGDLTAATLVTQVAWGSVFAALFGFSFGVLRVSTVVVAAIGGCGLFGLCREVGVSPRRAAAIVALWLLNPLVFSVTSTFMTDMHYISWALVASWCFARYLRTGSPREGVGAAVAATLAVLVRQQGVVLLASAALSVVLAGRDVAGGSSRRRWWPLVPPGVAFLAYHGGLLLTRGELPPAQHLFAEALEKGGLSGAGALAWRLPFMHVVLIGASAIPLLAGLSRSAWTRHPTRRQVVATASAFLLLEVGLLTFLHQHRYFPYGDEFTSAAGLGPADLIGQRPSLIGPFVESSLSVCAVAAAFLAMALVIRRVLTSAVPGRRFFATPEGLVAAILLGQVAASALPSFLFLNGDGTLDRYLLPGLAFGLVLVGWATTEVRVRPGPLLVGLLLLASVSVAGTRDFLSFQSGVWRAADDLVRQGTPATDIDGGAAWGGWNTSDGSFLRHSARTPQGPWWLHLYAPLVTSRFVVSSSAHEAGYRLVRKVPYESPFSHRPRHVYVLRRVPTVGS